MIRADQNKNGAGLISVHYGPVAKNWAAFLRGVLSVIVRTIQFGFMSSKVHCNSAQDVSNWIDLV